MVMPTFTMRQLLESGVHFGHQTHRWNPKMSEYIFGIRNKIHIMDLSLTVPLLYEALKAINEIAASGGRVLFVGTKRQASTAITEAAKRCGQYYVNHRWLGGMLTNWSTISESIKRLRTYDEMLAADDQGLTKKELLKITRERDKLERSLGGIKDMGGLPDIVFIIDTNKEALAVAEATKLGIPIVAILDSNSNPMGITYGVPGNDDALRAINLYCDLVCLAVLDGIEREMEARGVDIGATEEPTVEALPETAGAEEAAPKPKILKKKAAPTETAKVAPGAKDAPPEPAPEKPAAAAEEAKPAPEAKEVTPEPAPEEPVVAAEEAEAASEAKDAPPEPAPEEPVVAAEEAKPAPEAKEVTPEPAPEEPVVAAEEAEAASEAKDAPPEPAPEEPVVAPPEEEKTAEPEAGEPAAAADVEKSETTAQEAATEPESSAAKDTGGSDETGKAVKK